MIVTEGRRNGQKFSIGRLSRQDQTVEGRICEGAYEFLILVIRMFVCVKKKLSTSYEDNV